MCEANNSTAGNNAGAQRDGIMQQLAGVQQSLEKKGVSAAFYRASAAIRRYNGSEVSSQKGAKWYACSAHG